MNKKVIITLLAAVCLLFGSPAWAYGNTEEEYPLKGTFPYTMITKESIDKKLEDGWVFTSDPYVSVGECYSFTNNKEWSQVNAFRGHPYELSYDRILMTLAGLKPIPNPFYGSELNELELAVKDEIISYLNSYDWKNASDYEKAAYTAQYINARCQYKEVIGSGAEHNSAYSALVKGYAECGGFAQTYHVLTRAAGLKSVHVTNLKTYHDFNYVKTDGVWREIDISHITSFTSQTAAIHKFLSQEPKTKGEYLWERKPDSDFCFDPTISDQPLYETE